MLRYLFSAILILTALSIQAREAESSFVMTQDRLQDLILQAGSDVIISGNLVRFTYEGANLLCISDVSADRMRIISPIVDLSEIGVEQLLLALTANFHTALDARYAISDGVMYAVFIHPLGPLSEEEVISAIRQVARARNTFGTDYSSGELVFGGVSTP